MKRNELGCALVAMLCAITSAPARSAATLAVDDEYSKDHYKLGNLVYAGGYDPLLGTPALYGTVPPGNVQSVDVRLTFTY